MKLTKSKLKQLIKEIAEEELNISSGAEDPWAKDLEDLMQQTADFYDSLPDEGKEVMTQKFEEYAAKWRDEMPKEEEPWEEGEYEMLPRPSEDPMGRGAQTSKLRRQSTNWRKGEDFYETN